jgi:HSP20 family protein
LTIRAERKAEEGRTYLYNCRRHGQIERLVRLPEGLDATGNVQAQFTNGVLHISLPKAAEAKPRKIALQSR